MKINTKSKNFRIILFSVIGLAVLGGVVTVLSLTAPKDDKEQTDQTTQTTEDPALIVQPNDLGEIKSVAVENDLGTYTVNISKKDGEAEYTIKGLEKLNPKRLNTSAFTSLVNNLTNMTARSVVEENATDLAQYGLDKPIAKVKAEYEKGSFSFIVGNTVTSGAANYFLVEGSNTVYSYYNYSLNAFTSYDEYDFIGTTVMPTFDQTNAPDIKKVTVTRKDWDLPLIMEAMPELPEDSTSVQVFSYTFTSPYDVYLDLTIGNDFLNAMNGLAAEKAVCINPTDEDKKKYGIDDPFCEVDQLAGEEIYRLYIGNAITEEVKDEETGVTETKTVGYYGYSNKVPDIIFRFSAESLIWTSMDVSTYMSKLFLMPFIYDLNTVHYKDASCEFEVKIEGNNNDAKFYMDDKEIDGDLFRNFYQYLVGCRGEEIYTEDEKGDFIASFSYDYRDDRDTDTVTLYESSDRTVIIDINGKNVFKTKWNYQTRLLENAKAFLAGEEIVQNY